MTHFTLGALAATALITSASVTMPIDPIQVAPSAINFGEPPCSISVAFDEYNAATDRAAQAYVKQCLEGL